MIFGMNARGTVSNRWLGIVVLVGTSLALAGCQANALPKPSPSPSPTAPVIVPSGKGVVMGGIDFCGGVLPKKNPGFVAGTVAVLHGTTPVIPSPELGAAPKVASESVSAHHLFQFALPPGDYVIQVVPPSGANFVQWEHVVISVGKITKQNIPNGCL